jgi:hypothetical protein
VETSSVVELKNLLERAAEIRKRIPDRERAMLHARSGWPEYRYELEDLKHQEFQPMRFRPSGEEIDLLDRAEAWVNMLGTDREQRTLRGKQIIWAKACQFSFYDCAHITGIPPKTCENWYKMDIQKLAEKLRTLGILC